MKYAVINISGRQYLVNEGEKIAVDKLSKDPVYDVLLINDEGNVKIGQPVLDKKAVKFSVGETIKGKKIDVRKYKAKSRYRKHIGFRPQLTNLQIEKISI